MKFTDGLLIGMGVMGLIVLILVSFAYKKEKKFCPECGHKYEEQISYCQYDGTELKDVTFHGKD